MKKTIKGQKRIIMKMYNHQNLNGQDFKNIFRVIKTVVIVTIILWIFTYKVSANPVADFSYDISEGCAPVEVDFIDQSIGNIIMWTWYIDGVVDSISGSTISHTFQSEGTYLIWLIIFDNQGGSDTTGQEIEIFPGFTVDTDIVDATCNGMCDGSVQIIPSGGIAPYYPEWPNGDTLIQATNLCSGSYIVNVTDSSGCEHTVHVQIGQSDPLVLSVSTQDAGCLGECIGEATVSVSGGSPPYNYQWDTNPPQNTQTATGLCENIFGYSITVTDVNGCTTKDSLVTISTAVPIDLNLQVTDESCFGECDGMAVVTPTGGTPPYNYQWYGPNNTSSTDSIFSDLCSTLGLPWLMVYVEDASGCVQLDTSIYIIGPPENQVQIFTGDTMLCSSDMILLEASPGFETYDWNTGDTGKYLLFYYHENVIINPFWVVATDSNGCVSASDTVLITFDTTCVWPGDANNDGIVNNYDILAIGQAFGTTGPQRPNASLDWEAQPAPDWNEIFPDSVNYKHADCNGDGIINYDDTLAVAQNYGLIHAKFAKGDTASGPPLYMQMPDTIQAGQLNTFSIMYGSQDFPVDEIYGIAFTLNYDAGIMEDSISIAYTNSWIGTQGIDLLGFSKHFPTNGVSDIAITRIDQNNVFQQQGIIANVSFVIKDDLSGKGLTTLPMHFSFSGIKAINNQGEEIPVSSSPDSVVVVFNPVGIDEPTQENQISIYPNPAQDKLFIRSSEMMEGVEVYDVFGRKVLDNTLQTTVTDLNIEHLSAGYYIVKVQLMDRVEVRKIAVH